MKRYTWSCRNTSVDMMAHISPQGGSKLLASTWSITSLGVPLLYPCLPVASLPMDGTLIYVYHPKLSRLVLLVILSPAEAHLCWDDLVYELRSD